MLTTVASDLESAYSNPNVLVRELLHKAAFTGGLSNSLLPDPVGLGDLSAEALRQYVSENFVGSNMAVAAAGMSLADLQRIANPLIGSASGSAPSVKSSYTGGFLAALSPGAAPTVGVAFEAKGGLADLKSTAAAAVTKALLGSSTREVLPYVRKPLDAPLAAATPVVQMYKSTGLIGMVGTASGSATAAADALTSKLKSIASSVKDAHLTAAKQHALAGYQSAISAKSGVVQDMGLSLLSRGKFSAQEYAAAVSGLSSADVSKYVGEVLKSPLTLVAVGSLASLPKYDTVAGRLTA
eukprot:GHUV01012413.1.p1 GENE.GHUV01012413.1~~GHUV01012413.1.p1  ORF type:complete len:297 (+),score=111.87 GHUV01012413.1:1051-1941(+)